MPYIDKTARFELEAKKRYPDNAGELNYTFTRLALDYLKLKGERYQTYNDIIGALEGAKLELYRRHIAPYEDTKIQQNGDVT